MRTIKELRAAGYEIRTTVDAVGCTEVLSSQPFWYYNLNFYDSMRDIHEQLAPALTHLDGYRLVLAGDYTADEVMLPFNILDAARLALLNEARSRYIASKNDMERAEADYLDAVRTNEAYAD